MKSRSMDYEGPLIGLAAFLCGGTAPKNHASSQSPFDLNTRREDTKRPSEEGLI